MAAVPKKRRAVDEEYKIWISLQEHCCICGSPGIAHDDGTYRLDPNHITTKGAGGGDRGNLLPFCRKDHVKFHKLGRSLFSQLVKKDLHALAKAYLRRYQEEVESETSK